MVNRLSVSFFVCAGFLALFALVGFGGTSSGPAPVDLVLAAVVLGCGFYLRSGTELARLVGMCCLGLVVVVGAISFMSGHYVPGTIVAGFALARLASAAAAFGSGAAAPADPYRQQQPPYAPPPSPYAPPPSPYAPPPSPYAPPPFGTPPPGYGQPQYGPPQPPAPSPPQ
jgi:hypothetical protein